nr:serine/threonine-protein kinase [Micromonospora sp. DSM 115978]
MGLADGVRFLLDVCLGLTAVHKAGVVHRDLTPRNIVLSTSRGAVVIDFGISVAVDSNTITRPGDVIGTFAYMAPEALRGKATTHRADIYSLGATAVYATSGLVPFDGSAGRWEILAAAANGPDLDEVPRQLQPVLRRMLAVDPAARPPLAAVMDELTSLPVTDGSSRASSALRSSRDRHAASYGRPEGS